MWRRTRSIGLPPLRGCIGRAAALASAETRGDSLARRAEETHVPAQGPAARARGPAEYAGGGNGIHKIGSGIAPQHLGPGSVIELGNGLENRTHEYIFAPIAPAHTPILARNSLSKPARR